MLLTSTRRAALGLVLALVGHVHAAAPLLRIGICQPVLLDGINSQRPESLAVVGVAAQALEKHLQLKRLPEPDTAVIPVSPPRHGQFLVQAPAEAKGWPAYQYLGKASHLGNDQFVVRIELVDAQVEATYFTQVVRGDSAAASHCKRRFGRDVWRIQ